MTGSDRSLRHGALAAIAATTLLVALVLAPVTALAAEPAGSPATGGDPRSPGQGPGLVGDPLLAIGVVLGVGIAALVLTLAYVRLTDRRGDRR